MTATALGPATTAGSASVALESGADQSRLNNFTALRLIAASLVMVSHGFELPSGIAVHDWAFDLTQRSLAWYAVNMFFAISGYLVFASWLRKASAVAFISARFLRLMPGLLAMLVVTIAILGLRFSNLPFPAFVRNRETFGYFFGCLSIVFVKYDLPGVFAANPLPAVNGSLWTLRYEILCYAMVLVVGMTGLFRTRARRRVFLLGLLGATAAVLVVFDAIGLDASVGRLGALYELARLSICFELGMAYVEFGRLAPLRWQGCAILLMVSYLLVGTPLFTLAAALAVTYAAFWFAFVPQWPLLQRMRNAPDYSYGIYIYAFPVQQAIIDRHSGFPAGINFALCFAVTLAFAAVSWHLIEKPALSLKARRLSGAQPLAV